MQRLFFALWPTLPVLFPAVQLRQIKDVGRLPRLLLLALFAYLLLGSLAALATPNPLLSLGFVLFKSAWMGGLVVLGRKMGDPAKVWPVAAGLLIVYATAALTLVLSGQTTYRLTHPFFMPAALSLAAATGVLMALFVPHRWMWWRVTFAALSGLVLAAAASRVVAAGLVLAIVMALALRGGRGQRKVLPFLMAGVVLAVGASQFLPGISARLFNFSGLGRDEVWYSAVALIEERPWFGYGSYQAGAYLHPTDDCDLFYAMSFLNIFDGTCPAWVARLGNPWIVAHNEALQAILEGGLLGGGGFLMLLGVSVLLLLRSRDRFLVAIAVLGITVSVVDNPISFPSPFFAEFFFWCVGLAAARESARAPSPVAWPSLAAPLLAVAALLSPLWVGWFATDRQRGTVLGRISSGQFTAGEPYWIYGELDTGRGAVKVGTVKVLLRACTPICYTVSTIAVESGARGFWMEWKFPATLAAQSVTLELVVLDNGDNLASYLPLVRTRWRVSRE